MAGEGGQASFPSQWMPESDGVVCCRALDCCLAPSNIGRVVVFEMASSSEHVGRVLQAESQPGADYSSLDVEVEDAQQLLGGGTIIQCDTSDTEALESNVVLDSCTVAKASPGPTRFLKVTLEDEQLLRGCALPGLLRGFGMHFRATKLADKTFTETQGEWLYSHSRLVERIGEFMSHSWSASATAKYFALCLHFNSVPANVVTCLAALTVFTLMRLDVLPTWVVVVKPSFQIPIAFWCSFTGGFVYSLALLTWHNMPSVLWGGRSEAVFFDKLCVHQHDVALKEAGIRSFAAFISRSDRFVLLWSPDYFSRLWCVLEVAAYLHIRKSKYGVGAEDRSSSKMISGLIFWPLQLATLTGSTMVFFHTFILMIVVMNCLQMGLGMPRIIYYVAGAVLTFGSLPFLMHAFRSYARHHEALESQMTTFKVEAAECFDPADRALVSETIRLWFGSLERFDVHVQTHVAQEVRWAIPNSKWYPLRLSACAWTCVFVCFGLDWLDHYVRRYSVAPTNSICGTILLFTYPVHADMCMTLSLLIANHSAITRERGARWADICVSLCAAEGVALPQLALLMAGNVLQEVGTIATAGHLITLIGFAASIRYISLRRTEVS